MLLPACASVAIHHWPCWAVLSFRGNERDGKGLACRPNRYNCSDRLPLRP